MVGAFTLVIHGGAGEHRAETVAEREAALARSLDRGWKILSAGGSALDACQAAIVELEDEPVFDAGIGAHLNRDGYVELDAILMDGATLAAGAVGAVERIRNPILLARRVLDEGRHILLTGRGAELFATEHGMSLCDPAELVTEHERARWLSEHRHTHSHGTSSNGTVGAVACDAAGNIAAGTSTGGTFLKHPGRIGDSPLIGCGCYADNLSAAVSCTGHGESIMRVVMAKAAADLVAAGHSPQVAADRTLQIMTDRTARAGGLILLDRSGAAGAAFSTARMPWAVRSSSGLIEITA
jgi:beta-aspartyl-peptidase (threonine type)